MKGFLKEARIEENRSDCDLSLLSSLFYLLFLDRLEVQGGFNEHFDEEWTKLPSELQQVLFKFLESSYHIRGGGSRIDEGLVLQSPSLFQQSKKVLGRVQPPCLGVSQGAAVASLFNQREEVKPGEAVEDSLKPSIISSQQVFETGNSLLDRTDA